MPAQDMKPLTLDLDLEAWERQPGETARRHAQFCAYRDAGRARTLRKVSENLTLQPNYVRQVAAAYHWVDRAQAWDSHRDDLHQQAWLDERRKAAERDAQILSAAVDKLARAIDQLDVRELMPRDLIRLLDVALRHRRTLFGDPQMTVALTGPGGDPLSVQLAEFQQLAPEQRRAAITELAASVTRRVRAISGTDDDDE